MMRFPKIAILIPLLETVDETGPLFTQFLPSFNRTKSFNDIYTLYLGVNSQAHCDKIVKVFETRNDESPRNESPYFQLNINLFIIPIHLAHATCWGPLFKCAYADGNDYFFQTFEDVKLMTHGWSIPLVDMLKNRDNIGIVGPVNPADHQSHIDHQIPFIVHQVFSHRTHYDLLATLVESVETIDNSWISHIYKDEYSTLVKAIEYHQRTVCCCDHSMTNKLLTQIAHGVDRFSNFLATGN